MSKTQRARRTLALSAGLFALPVLALAQTVSHAPTYSAAAQVAPDLRVQAKSALPLLDPRLLPPQRLLQNNALPTGQAKPSAGAMPSSGGPNASPLAYGTFSPQSIAPYTTARSSASKLGGTPNADAVAITSSPWRSAGLLLFNEPGGTYQCSASLIRPGLVVTAAHCVYPFGANSPTAWYTNHHFYPAVYDNTAPYGSYTASNITIATAYYNGTDTCTTRGVVCNDDIAIITLNANEGSSIGWYGYGWNGYSYVSSFGGASLASITQLGYPVAFDGGRQQERTDGVGSYYAPGSLKNTLLGSAQTGGSSGGPWMVNFGASPSVNTSQASLGQAANADIVVGVTSWGYTSVGTNTQGASWFGQTPAFPNGSYTDSHGVFRGAGNIGALVAAACSSSFSRC